MPDISMCQNEGCPLKKKCYRYTATPSVGLQTYGWFKPDEEGKCDYYWDNKDYKDGRRNNN
jgi:hypothetical protein